MNDFEKEFIYLIDKRRADMLEKYNRVLPTNELFFDRWEKGKYLNFGKDSNIYDSSIVMGEIKVGNNCWIGPYTILEGISANLIIGDWVCISSGVMIFTHDTVKHFLSGGKEPFYKKDVNIGSNTQIGTMSMICAGVTIGSHCVIGANSFVNSDIPDYSIAVGTPAKVIGKIEIINDKVKFNYFKDKGE